ncbi:MAG: nuclear transport factor 2 family protein [Thermoleophilaceae bacterium]
MADRDKAPSKPRRSGRAKAIEQVATSYFEAVAARDPDAMAAHWHPDGVGDLVPIGILRGPGAVRSFFSEMFDSHSRRPLRRAEDGGRHPGAAVQWRLRGTFEGGAFQGIEPTGRTIELRGCDCLEVDGDGKLTRNTAYYDGAAFARQVGMLPAQDGGADRAVRAGFNAVTRLRSAVTQRTRGGSS